MKIYRTDLNANAAAWYAQMNEILEEQIGASYWTSIDKDTENQVDYYINSDTFLRVSISGSQNASIGLWKGETNKLVWGGTYNYFNSSVYKQNDCIFVCSQAGNGYNGTYTNYSYTADFIIDTIENSTEKGIVYHLSGNSGSSYCYVLNSVLNGAQGTYAPYSAYSLNSNANAAQFAPFINSLDGKKFDNLHGVLLTPVTNTIPSMGNAKWLVSNGFAVSCGDSEPEYIYV